MAELEIDGDNVSEPEPSSPRRVNSATTQMGGRSKQEVALTSSGGSNASSITTTHNIHISNNNNNNNYNRNFRNAQYELVDGTVTAAVAAPHHHHQQQQQQQHQSRGMSTYRNSNNSNAENWYNSTNGQGSSSSTAALATATSATTKPNNIRVHQKSMSNRIMSLKRENKTTQTLAIVVGGFIACWLPFFIAYLVTPFLEKDTIDDGFNAFLTWLGWFNSAMNPFIYALYSVDFRAAFWRLTCRRFCKNMRKAPYASNTYSIRRT